MDGGINCDNVLRSINGVSGPTLHIYSDSGVTIGNHTALNRIVIAVKGEGLNFCPDVSPAEQVPCPPTTGVNCGPAAGVATACPGAPDSKAGFLSTKDWGYANWNNGGSGGWGYSDTVATLTGSSTVDANRNTFKISNMGTASDFSPFAEGSSLNFGAINYWGDVIIRADSIRFPLQYNSTASDTSLVKPLVISPSGKIGRLISWSLIGGGGGSQNLQQVTDIGNTTTKSIQVGDSLRVQGGNDPFVAMKQATSNQEYRLRVGVGTGVSSQSFSLYDATAGASRMVITTAGHMVLGRESLPADHSRLLVYGGLNGANIDALPDSTQNDESNMEVMGADYYGSSFQGYGVAMTYNGNANTGSIMNYSRFWDAGKIYPGSLC
jgi:hypothetical protein